MDKKNIKEFSNEILDNYKKYNIENIEISTAETINVSLKTRKLQLENIERSKNININVNLYKDNKKATISANNIEKINPVDFLEKGSAMVKFIPVDEFCGLPENKYYEKGILDLDLVDEKTHSDEDLIDQAKTAEEIMLNSKKITNTEGSSRSFSKVSVSLLNSNGFNSNYTKTFHSLSSIAIAGHDTNMQRDYEYSTAIHSQDLEKPEKIGQKAAERASSRLNSKKIRSCTLDVVFEPRVAKSILSSFATCTLGSSIARGTSFLNKKLNTQIFKESINISNNPRLKRGLGSKPFDSDGIKNENILIVQKGLLKNYFLNTRSSRQLKIPINGNSGPSNLILDKGKDSLNTLLENVKNGFYVTEMLGMSFNPVNGDYSRGAAGFKIDNGKITFPVSEVTIAGNMIEMLTKLTPADDLDINDNINSPSILIENMTLAGL